VDLVGDVHGEIDLLRGLLAHLGYAPDGSHREGRRLVFLGDLTDRGHDSPAVVDLVQELVRSARAQCVLGNHDLNLLLDHEKPENVWFYGKAFQCKNGEVVPQVLADGDIRKGVLAFFGTLPLALEREDLRVVHACWRPKMISVARAHSDAVELYHRHADQIRAGFAEGDLRDEIDLRLALQNGNPVKVLTSGLERQAAAPFEAGGRIRQEERVPWWETYYDREFCVFGHYGIPFDEPRPNGNAFCVDYGVGKRWTERRAGFVGPFRWRLAALRIPEQVIVFDNGEWQPRRGPRRQTDASCA
jgi:hypothetical protein